MSFLYVLTIVFLLCTPKYWKTNKCVRNISLAERESAQELKEIDAEEFDEESFTTHMHLLSLSNARKEEDENIEELGAVGGIGEMEELGAVGGTEEIEETESDWSSESEDEYGRERRDSRKGTKSKKIEEYEDTTEEFIEKIVRQRRKYDLPEQSSLFPVYQKPYEIFIDIDEDVLEVFVDSINRSNALLPTISVSLIQKYLEAGINGEERISKLHNEYPLNRCKRIDFKNLRKPFGTEMEGLKNMNEDQLNDTLFFDDFFVCSLNSFLKDTKVGNFPLAEVYAFYREGYIRFIPCNIELLDYLSSQFPNFDINYFLYRNMGIYLGRCHNYFWTFWHKRVPLIQKSTRRNKITIEQLKMERTYRNLTLEEMKALRKVFNNEKKHISGLRKLLKKFEKRIEKMNKDLRMLLQFFPVNMNYLYREERIITCIHYILTFCIKLIKPLYDKAQKNVLIEYNMFSNSSSSLNELLNLVEMLEFNSEIHNIFCTLYPQFDKYYPRLKSSDEIIAIYNYLLVKLQSVVVIFDINKFLLALHMSRNLIRRYRNNAFFSYISILSEAEDVFGEAKKLLKELTKENVIP
ncbi:conserved Plasmodium protein, unknown function [Plasmodium ovale]|uniref:KELT protein n=1 Tax=Plasmodium ovale TaxID=36330 RepID=A0A1C3KWI9_PLAOA|nr:conserved Plasmodium protein, unknown function [Plasmodium ovale]